MAILLQHLLLSSIALFFLYLMAIPLRWMLKHDVIVRYRLQATLLVLAAMLLPIHFLFCEFYFQPRRRIALEHGESFTNTLNAPSTSDAYHQFDATTTRPLAIGVVPEHDIVSQGTFQPEDSQGRKSIAALTSHQSESSIANTRLPAVRGKNRVETALWEWTNENLIKYLGLIYLIGVVVVVSQLCRRVVGTLVLMRHSEFATDTKLLGLGREILGDDVSLRINSQITSPACITFPQKTVLLPDWKAVPLGEQELRCVLIHEGIHLRRRDWIICCFEQCLITLMWFHPVARRIVKDTHSDRELSCDAEVVRTSDAALTYAKALLTCCRSAGSSDLSLAVRFSVRV